MGFWEMYYNRLRNKEKYPWLYEKKKSLDEGVTEFVLLIIATLEVLGFSGLLLYVACPSLFA